VSQGGKSNDVAASISKAGKGSAQESSAAQSLGMQSAGSEQHSDGGIIELSAEQAADGEGGAEADSASNDAAEAASREGAEAELDSDEDDTNAGNSENELPPDASPEEILHSVYAQPLAAKDSASEETSMDDFIDDDSDDEVDEETAKELQEATMSILAEQAELMKPVTAEMRETVLPVLNAASDHVQAAWCNARGAVSLRGFMAFLLDHNGAKHMWRCRPFLGLRQKSLRQQWNNCVHYVFGGVENEMQADNGVVTDIGEWRRRTPRHIVRCEPPAGVSLDCIAHRSIASAVLVFVLFTVLCFC
jgi:hypothetical protein